jgi:hypothetical protein
VDSSDVSRPEEELEPVVPADVKLSSLTITKSELPIVNLINVGQQLQSAAAPFINPAFLSRIESAATPQLDAARNIYEVMSPVLGAQANFLQTSLGASWFSNSGLVALSPALISGPAPLALFSQQITRLVSPVNAILTGSITGIDWLTFTERIAALLPPNWSDDVDYGLAMAVLSDEGIPLVWVPRADLVELLVSADSETARREILVENADAIVDDLQSVLDVLETSAYLGGHIALTKSAVATLVSGFDSAAQALATTVLDSLVMAYVGAHKRVPKAIRPVTDDMALKDFALAAALTPIVRAYEPYWPSQGDPVPRSYNRHATVHSGSPLQFSRANALVSVMLTTSFLQTISAHSLETRAGDQPR